MSDRPSRILSYWRAVELFSPQNIPKRKPKDDHAPVFEPSFEGEPLPWQTGHVLRNRKIKDTETWTHTVYVGIFELDRMRDLVEGEMGPPEDSFEPRPRGESCLCSFSVTGAGYAIAESLVISSAAWATGRTFDPGFRSEKWLVGFEKLASELSANFDRKMEVHEQTLELQVPKKVGGRWQSEKKKVTGTVGSKTVDQDLLARLIRWVSKKLNVEPLIQGARWRIQSRLISNSKYFDVPSSDMLNSFFHSELRTLSGRAEKGSLGPCLDTFLKTNLEPERRKDLVQRPDQMFELLDPENFPKGRWPTVGKFPLVAGQQVAVSSAMRSISDGHGLFSVNGPPGTGKTTLLRDLIAAVIVERADRLAELRQPEWAFEKEKESWKAPDRTLEIHRWKSDLVGFEMVIASNNNGAVENITLEIPSVESADPHFAEGVDAFAPFATRLLQSKASKKPIEQKDLPEAWALLAATLGKQANRRRFLSGFFYGDDDDKSNAVESKGFFDYLREFADDQVDWPAAVSKYRQAVAKEQGLRRQRALWARRIREQVEALDTVQSLEISAAEISRQVMGSQETFEKVKGNAQRASEAAKSALAAREQHHRFKPGCLQIIFSLGRAQREWNDRDRDLAQQLIEAEELQKHRDQQVLAQERLVVDLEKQSARISERLSEAQKRLFDISQSLDRAREVLGDRFPDAEIWAKADKTGQRELSSPWADEPWNDARVEVFMEAIRLHRAFVLANKKKLFWNLKALAALLNGQVPADAPPKATLAVWQTLFFVVPCVSTTFASFARLFHHLGQGKIGWLLVDEAGQATPQSAAGALWRSRRAVIVGDPLQLEPIVGLSFRLQDRLKTHFGVAQDFWIPSRSSVQTLADRQNLQGAYLETEDETVWIGSPLWVHRRCDHPMFDISNETAYNGLMVHAVLGRKPLELQESVWVHVAAQESEGHWIPEEGRRIVELLKQLRRSEEWIRKPGSLGTIYLLSPFRDVVDGLRRQVKPELESFSDLDLHIGTIHTAQGKEANIVFFVLGGNPQKDGAKAWASKKPNLLNVAASRAKRRFYVVGDRAQWKKHPHFGVMARLLPEL